MRIDRKKVRVRIRTVMAVVAVAALGLWFAVGPWPRLRSWWTNRHLWAALDRKVPRAASAPIPLGAFVKQMRTETASPDLPGGVPIYIDPVGLTEAGANLNAPVTLDPGDLPLGTSYETALGRIGLGFRVQDRLVTITSKAAARSAD